MRVKSPLKTVYNLLVKKVPMEAQLIVTRGCNLSCGYCTEYDNVSKPVPLDVLKARIDALHKLKVVNISMLGGEPLMHPEIDEVIRYADKGAQVSLTTNGFLLTEEMIDRLNKSGLMNLEVSVDALNADRTGFIQKNLKTLKPKLVLLKKLAKFDVHVNIVLCESSKNEFKETLEEFRQLGLFVAVDLLHTPEGQIDIHGPEYLKLWEHHYDKGMPLSFIEYDYGKALLEGKKPNWKCRAGSRFLYVDEFGNVQLCSSQRNRPNKSVLEYTIKDVKEQHKKYKGCEVGCSLLCAYRDSILDNAPLKAATTAWQVLKIQAEHKRSLKALPPAAPATC